MLRFKRSKISIFHQCHLSGWHEHLSLSFTWPSPGILRCWEPVTRIPSLSVFIRPSSDGTYYGMVMSVRPSGSPSVRHSYPHFSPTCFDILIWNFVYHFIFMHVRSSSNAINFRHFLQELCSFLTSNSYKYAVFRNFLLHALTYWVQILFLTLF